MKGAVTFTFNYTLKTRAAEVEGIFFLCSEHTARIIRLGCNILRWMDEWRSHNLHYGTLFFGPRTFSEALPPLPSSSSSCSLAFMLWQKISSELGVCAHSAEAHNAVSLHNMLTKWCCARLADEIMRGAGGEEGGGGVWRRDPRVYCSLITAASLTFHLPRAQREEEEGGRCRC